MENQRFYDKLYGNEKPYLSESQDFMFFPHLSSAFQNGIDVYDCSKEDFFLSKEEVSRDDPSFVCTLLVEPNEAFNFSKVVTHSDSKDLIFVIGQDYILKFDLSDAVNGVLNSNSKMDTVKAADTYRLTHSTYDRIIDMRINKDDVAESWVCL